MFKFKVNDKVIVLSGRDKGKIGTISKIKKKIFGKKRQSIFFILEGINLLKKHVKANPNKNKPGGIVKIESPVASSNVSLVNPITNKKDKIYFKVLDNGKKNRIFRSNGEILK